MFGDEWEAFSDAVAEDEEGRDTVDGRRDIIPNQNPVSSIYAACVGDMQVTWYAK